MSEAFDPYYKWLAIPPEEQPPNHYRLLGLRLFEVDEDVIGNAADARMLQIRSFQTGAHAKESQQILREISAARVCLLRPESREEYDAALRQASFDEFGAPVETRSRPPLPPSKAREQVVADSGSEFEPAVRVRTTSMGAPPVAAKSRGSAEVPSELNLSGAEISSPATRAPAARARRKSNSMIPIVALATLALFLIVLAVVLTRGEDPSITIKKIVPPPAYVGEEISIRAEVDEQNWNGKIAWSLNEPPFGARIDRRKGRLTWTPTREGKFVLHVVASSGDVECREDVKIEVLRARTSAASGQVRISPIEDRAVNQGESIGFFVTLADNVGDAEVRYSLGEGADSGAKIDSQTGSFSWTPSYEQRTGDYEFTVYAESNRGASRDQRRFKITVREARPLVELVPIVAYIPDKTVAPGELLQFTVAARDPNTPPKALKFELDFPPTGAGIHEQTGEFSWTVGEHAAGRSIRVAVRVTQTDEPRKSTVQAFQVHVKGESAAPPDRPIADAKGVRTFAGHKAFVAGVAISRQADAIASCSIDGELRIWSVETGEPLHELPSDGGSLSTVAFSPDGSRIAAGGTDNVVRVWDRRSGEKQKELNGLEGAVRTIVFSPDGERIAAGSSAAVDVQMWNVESGGPPRTFKPVTRRENDFVLCLAFRTDGSRLAAGRLSSTMTIWEASSGREERSVKTGLISALAYSADNRVLVSADLAKKLVFWQFGSAMESVERMLEERPTLVLFTHDAKRLAVALGARQVQIWDPEQRKVIQQLDDAAMTIRDMAFTADGQQLVLVGSEGNNLRVRTWKLEQ